MYYHQLNTFAINKDEWDSKDDTGKSMKNKLYVLPMPKGTSWGDHEE